MDPLKFQVAITDNATSTLEAIQKLLNNLKDVTINVAAGGDIKSLLSSLEKSGNVAVSAEKAAAALKKEEEALLKLKAAAADADREITRLEYNKRGASSDVSDDRTKLEILKNSGDAARKAAEGYQEYYQWVKKAQEEISKIKTNASPVSSIEDATKKTFAETRDFYRRAIYEFAQSIGKVSEDPLQLKSQIEKYREALIRLRDEGKHLLTVDSGSDMSRMVNSLERVVAEYDKVIHKADEMRAKNLEATKYYDIDDQIRRRQESLQRNIQVEAKANEQLSQAKQNQSQLNQQIAQQEQKVAEARERLVQATQKQSQGDQQTAQTLNAEAQAAGQAAGQLSKLLADKNAVTEAENKLAQASMTNVAAFIAEGESAQKASAQIGAIVMLLERVSQIKVPDTTAFTQSLNNIAGVKAQGTGLEQLGSHLGDAADKIKAAKEAIKGGRFGELAKRIDKATESIEKLDVAFGKFHLTIGKDQGLKDFMTGLGEIVTKVRAQMQSLGSGTQTSGLDKAAENYRKNVAKVDDALYRVRNLNLSLGNKLSEAKGLGINVDNRQIYMLQNYIKLLQQARSDEMLMTGKGWVDSGNSLKHLMSETNNYIKVLDGMIEKQKQLALTEERVANVRRQSGALIRRLTEANDKGWDLGLSHPGVSGALASLRDFNGRLSQADMMDAGAIQKLILEFQRLKYSALDAAKAAEKVNSNQEKLNKSIRSKDAKDTEQWAQSMNQASIEANKLIHKMRELKAAKNLGKSIGADTSELEREMAIMQRYLDKLFAIKNGARQFGHTSDWLGKDEFKNASFNADKAATSINRLSSEKQKAASSTAQLTAEEQRLAQALGQTTEHAKGQSQVLSDLKSMAMQYLGVWGGQQFLHNIIEIGGQLEMQRMSIGAILQNQSQANDLFEKIKGLAVQSPFGVVELDQMTKQLTAYGFKYSELFDMTKRLADISAATGTGVDRLALALGHVRSEAALSGYTLRQFSMGNVPLLAKLSEKLGKTTQEIRKMVRAKEISYEDVEGVIKDLTNEGGMFYNMQEVISQSVKARFKNVKDAMAIMYGEMAESGIGDVLKSVADALMEITKNWKDVATVMGTGVAVWAAQRAAILAYTSLIGKETAATFASIGANVKKQGSMLQLANKYRVLTTAERDLMNASRANSAMIRLRTMLGMNYTKAQGVYIAAQRTIITNTLTQSLSEGKLTIAELAHMVATRKLSHEEARLIIMNSSLDASMKAQMLSIIGSTRRLGVLEMAYRRVGMAIKSLMGSLAAFAPMVIISGLMELWQRNSREMERAQEVADNVYERSQEALKNTRTMMQETDIKSYWRKDKDSKWEDVSGNFGGQIGGERKIVLPSIDTSNAQEAIEKWSQYIKDYAATPNSILNNALFDTKENVRSLEEQFDNLKHKVVEVADAQVLLQGLSGSFEDALKGTNGGWFDDDLITNIEDYNKSLKEFGKNVSSVYKSYRKSIDIAIKSARQQDDAFDKAVQSMGTYAQQFEFLVKNQEDYTNAVKAFKEAGGANAFSEVNESGNFLQNKYYKTTFDEVKEQQKTMEADMNRFFITMDEELERKGYKIGQMTVAQQQAVLLGFKTQFEGLKLSSQETLDYLMGLVSQHYGIELDVKDELFRAKVDEATRLLNGLVNGEWKVDLNFATNINDVIDKARKNYKTAKEYFENAKPIMMKFGVNASFGKEIPLMKMTEILNGIQDKGAKDFVEQVMKGWNEAAKAIQQSIDASTKGGFSLEDPNKSKKNKNKSGSKKSYKDPDVERWKERMKNLKAAYDEYEKLEKEFGHDEAILRVKRAFKGLIDEKDIDNIKEYRKELVEIKNKALDRYNLQKKDKSKDYGKQAQQLAREAEKAINDIDLGEQKRRSDEYLSKLKLQLDELKKQWETFNKVRMATGNEEIAAKVAGLSQDQASKRDIANSVKANIQDIIKEMGGEVKVPIKFDVTSSDKDIENNVKAALGGSEKYREQIKGIVEAIKTWRDLERDAMQKSVDAYTQAISKAMDYESQVARINAELEEQNRLVDQNNNLSQGQKDRAKSINQANASMKALEASDSYKRFFNGIFGETQTELKGMANTIKAELNYSLEKGAITAEDYAKKIKDIDDVMKQSEISDPDKWYNKGIFNTESMEQRNQRLYGEGNEKYQEGADVFQKGVESGDEAMQKAGQEMMKNGQKMMDGAKGAAQTMAIIDKVVHGVDQSIQGTVKAFDYLKEMLDSFGVESETMSSVGDYLHTLGEMSSHVTQSWDNFKSDNFIGAGVEAVGAVTSVIKGLNQAHDNRLERAIERLRDDVKAIEANTELIAKARERTLGYDMGDVRRQMSQQYAQQQFSGSGIQAYIAMLLSGGRQNQSMYEYYSKNSQGTGYQQEYDNLIEQREKYMEILKDQQDKKKKSNDEIEETKAKIAELDDQIAYFTQDLAKELWSIDIKGWADQLSDALASAFENGENMAKAYRDTVTQIIQQMMQKMMQLAILEPMFERLQKQLFGENGNGGVFDPNNPKGSMSKITAMIGDFFGKGGEGEKAITASMEFMTAFQRGMQNAGLTVLNEASNTLSSSMQGTTEETSGLLAGYVNALRQDVSVNRILLTQFVSQMWPDYMDTFVNQVTAVQNIDTNVQVIMTMMQMGNGAMFNEIAAMRSRIDNVVMGIDKFAVK